MLTKDQILNTQDLQIEEVEVPEWGGTVAIKTMTGSERDIYEEEVFKRTKAGKINSIKGIRPLLLSMTLVDENGERLFKKEEDVKALDEKNASVVSRLWEVSQRVSGLSADDVEEVKKN